jgi:hypothetical protein
LMPLIVELSRVVGEPHGGWVHWGATTQNITQTGDVLVLRKVHRAILGLLGSIMTALADLADRSAEMITSPVCSYCRWRGRNLRVSGRSRARCARRRREAPRPCTDACSLTQHR